MKTKMNTSKGILILNVNLLGLNRGAVDPSLTKKGVVVPAMQVQPARNVMFREPTRKKRRPFVIMTLSSAGRLTRRKHEAPVEFPFSSQ